MTERAVSSSQLSRRFRLVLTHLAEEARRDIEGIGARPERAIHSLRTRMKNLRAVLALVKPCVPKDERKVVLDLAGSLKDVFARQRDAHVVAMLRDKLDGRAGKSRDLPSRSPAVVPDRMTKLAAARLARCVGVLPLDGVSWAGVIAAYVDCYREGRKAMKRCMHEADEGAFHRWRRPVKDLFYQTQVLQPLDGMKARRQLADRLGDRLGRLHDLHILEAGMKKAAGSPIGKRIAKKKKELKASALKCGRKLFAARPRDIGRELERCVKFQPALAARAVRQT